MRKSMVALQIISLLGLTMSFISIFIQTDNNKMLISLFTFIGFGCIGMVAVHLQQKIEQEQEIEEN